MRILAVRGCNLASLEGPFAVEFDRGPLRRAGLFAITGPTGAGKSTILDALCLALFDRMPRLPDGRGVPLGPEGSPDALSTTDVRTVLRRGAGSGWAEVDFVGIDGEAYRARWELRRARQNARGAYQKQSVSLTSLDGTRRFGDGKTSVLEEIVRRLGLSFEQFRRAVLLAQGDFASFLKAPAKERSALLELLTGTDIYSRISVAAHERCVAEQRALQTLEAQCAGIGVLGDDERAALDAEAAAAQAAVQDGERRLDAAKAEVAWHERDGQLAAAEAEAAASAADADRAWQEAGPRRQDAVFLRRLQPLRPHLTAADAAHAEGRQTLEAKGRADAALLDAREAVDRALAQHAEARDAFETAAVDQRETEPALERAAALDEQIATLAAEQTTAEGDRIDAAKRVSTALGDWTDLEAALAAARRDAAERERWLAGHAPLAPVAEQWARWDAVLIRQRDAGAAHAEAEAEVRRCHAEATEQEDALERLGSNAHAAQAALAAADAALAAIQGETVPDLAEVSRRRAALTARRDALSGLLRLAETAARLDQERAAAKDERDRQIAAAAAAEGTAVEAGATLERRKAALDEAEAALRRLHLAGREDVASLRGQLVAGEPCPVCGSADHPWRSADSGKASPLARLAREQEERVAALKAEVTAILTAHAGHEAAGKAARRQADALDTRLALLARERRDLAQRWTEATREAAGGDTDLPPDPACDAVSRRLAATQEDLAAVALAESVALDHKERSEAAARTRRECEAAVAEVTRAIEQRQRRRDAARHAEALAAARRDRAARDQDEGLAELAPHFAALEGWEAAVRTDPEDFRTATASQVRAVLDQREAHARAMREAEALAGRSATKAVELDAARHAEAQARQRSEFLTERLTALRAERAGLLGGQSVAAVKQALAEARHRAEALVERATVARQEATARLSAAEQDAAIRDEAARRCADKATAATKAAADAADACSVTLDEARRHLTRGEDWLAAEEKALSGIDAARRESALLAAERVRLRREHAEARLSAAPAPETPVLATPAPAKPAIEDARAMVATSVQALEEARGRLGEVLARLRADAENRGRLTTVQGAMDEQRKAHALWATLDQLIGSADGRKLRNFAQSLSLDLLLVQANRYLEDLARRYRLERVAGADLEIQVVDREMGDERRGVHSLSGGELFLVSLALALGLSAMAAGDRGGGIGTLFIDEGFGTLDPESLDLALSCLEALQASGRQVGVISHVPAMVERIGVQVRVLPLGGGRSTVSVVRSALPSASPLLAGAFAPALAAGVPGPAAAE